MVIFQELNDLIIMSSELQFKVLRLLEANPQLSQRELSKSLGGSLGGINYCLKASVSRGGKVENFKNNKNKFAYAYLLPPQGIAQKSALTGAFLNLNLSEYQELKAEIDELSQEVKAEEIGANQFLELDK